MFDRCRHWQRKLTSLTDGTLPMQQCKALEDHLSRCARCRAVMEADVARQETLQTHTGLLDRRTARVFDDRVIARLVVRGPIGGEAPISRPLFWFDFLTQILGGAFAAAAITVVCLMPTLRPVGDAPHPARPALAADMRHSAPPVPLEWLLQTASPRATLLWTPTEQTAGNARPQIHLNPPVDNAPIQPATHSRRPLMRSHTGKLGTDIRSAGTPMG